jgi:hypothetical protein
VAAMIGSGIAAQRTPFDVRMASELLITIKAL